MTNEDAIKIIECGEISNRWGKEGEEVERMAIKALEQQACGDAVSREDVLMALTGEWTESTDELIHRFIRRIKKLPSVNPAEKQEPCEDAVSREAVLDIFADNADATRPYSTAWGKIRDLPSVNPQPKIGHWIYDDSANNWRCDKCGETPKTMGYVGTINFMAEHFKFCNHCGAKMVEPQKSEG